MKYIRYVGSRNWVMLGRVITSDVTRPIRLISCHKKNDPAIPSPNHIAKIQNRPEKWWVSILTGASAKIFFERGCAKLDDFLRAVEKKHVLLYTSGIDFVFFDNVIDQTWVGGRNHSIFRPFPFLFTPPSLPFLFLFPKLLAVVCAAWVFRC